MENGMQRNWRKYMINKEKFTMTNEEDNLYDRMKCCNNPEHETVEQKNYSKHRFTEEYTCKNCKKTIVYYIRMLRYEKYDKNGNLEYDLPLADEPLY